MMVALGTSASNFAATIVEELVVVLSAVAGISARG